MSQKEQPQPPEPFTFTERERLFNRISHERFRALTGDEQTSIHHMELSYNTYGEFLFVTVSLQESEQRTALTFYGLGFHDYREKWITDYWEWYRTHLTPEKQKQTISREELEAQLKERLAEIAPYLPTENQSPRGKLFELLADLTDEDGAWSELQDWGDDADLDL